MPRLMTRVLPVTAICLLLAARPAAAAADISYTIMVNADYTVNGVPFSDAPLSITASYDPTMILSIYLGEHQSLNLSATLSGPGFGTANFTGTGTIAMLNTVGGVVPPYFGLGTGPSTPTYFLTIVNSTAFGNLHLANPPLNTPITGTPLFSTSGVSTSDGLFAISATYGQGTVTFQAVAAPEPSSWLLVGLTAAAGAFFKRRRATLAAAKHAEGS